MPNGIPEGIEREQGKIFGKNKKLCISKTSNKYQTTDPRNLENNKDKYQILYTRMCYIYMYKHTYHICILYYVYISLLKTKDRETWRQRKRHITGKIW